MRAPNFVWRGRGLVLKGFVTGDALPVATVDDSGKLWTAEHLFPGSTAILLADGVQVSSVTVDANGVANWTLAEPVAGDAEMTYRATVEGSGGKAPFITLPPVDVPPSTYAGPLLGVYGGSGQDAKKFFDFIGKIPTGAFVEVHNDKQGPDSFKGLSGFDYNVGVGLSDVADKVAAGLLELRMQMQLWANADMTAAGRGDFNAVFYESAVNMIATVKKYAPTQTHCWVRPFQEANADYGTRSDWASQYVRGSTVDPVLEDAFKKMWINFVNQYRQAAIDSGVPNFFRFNYCVNSGSQPYKGAFPGKAYVDEIGIDLYQGNGSATQPDPNDQFEFQRTMQAGLDEVADWAEELELPFSIPEFGFKQDNYSPWVAKLHAWARTRKTVSMGYWNSTAAYNGRISEGQMAQTAQQLRHEWNPAVYEAPVYTPPAVGADGSFDPSSSNAGLTFSDNGLTATNNTGGKLFARVAGAIQGLKTIGFDTHGTGIDGVGVVTKDAGTISDGFIGARGDTIGYGSDGGVARSYGRYATLPAYRGKVAIAMNQETGNIWFHAAGQPWNGDASANPATPSGGYYIADLGGNEEYFGVMLKPGQSVTIIPASAVSLTVDDTPALPEPSGDNLFVNADDFTNASWKNYQIAAQPHVLELAESGSYFTFGTMAQKPTIAAGSHVRIQATVKKIKDGGKIHPYNHDGVGYGNVISGSNVYGGSASDMAPGTTFNIDCTLEARPGDEFGFSLEEWYGFPSFEFVPGTVKLTIVN